MSEITIRCPRCGRHTYKEFLNVKGGCSVCDWLNLHSDRLYYNGFDLDDVMHIVESFLYKKYEYVNDIVDHFEGKYTINECIGLINHLQIANRKIRIKLKCEQCGNDVEKTLSVYKKNKYIFCSRACYWKYRSESGEFAGEKSSSYRRIKTTCSNCGDEIEVIPYDYNKVNSYGDHHNFCSQHCYFEFRRKYYIKEKHPMYQHQYTDEQLLNIRRAVERNSKNVNHLNSKIQLKVNAMLDERKIKYEREFTFEYYHVDNFLINNNLIIEVMGDYWHGNPLIYNYNGRNLNYIQLKTILKDKQKKGYLDSHYGIPILYLWESDINKNPLLCEKLIDIFLCSAYELKNFHSFNYHIDNNNNLILNSDIITPYQDMHSKDYAYISA